MAFLNNCNINCNCTGVSVVTSIIVGIITAFLRFTGVITVTPAFLWVTLGVAVVYLAVLLVTTALTRKRGCCAPLSAALIGILGTALFSVLLLGVTFAATSIAGAIFTGLLLGFASLILTSVACLTDCLADCDD